MVVDKVNAGTSRNAGSDKQTYYKLTLSGGEGDSVREMAQTLFSGGAMDGDNALVEAALSARGFLHLCDLGVPFPQNRYGEFIGYKTDHDPRQRATSVGRKLIAACVLVATGPVLRTSLFPTAPRIKHRTIRFPRQGYLTSPMTSRA